MGSIFFFFSFIFSLSINLFFQQKNVIKGRVFDIKSLQPIPYAHIEIEGSIFGVEADAKGKFELPIHQDDKTIIISANRYQKDTFTVSEIKSKSFFLKPKIIDLEEIFIGGISAQEYMKMVVRNIGKYSHKDTYEYKAYTENHTYGFDTKGKTLYTYSDKYGAITVIFGDTLRKYDKKKKDSISVPITKAESRLVLYERTKKRDARNHPFLNQRFDKLIRKGYKYSLKEGDSALKRKEIRAMKRDFNLPIEDFSGNPNYVYFQSGLHKYLFPPIDTSQYEKISFWFETSPYAKETKDVIIGYKTKKLNNIIYQGTITINKKDLFPYDIKQNNKFMLPLVLKPLMRLFTGFNVKNIYSTEHRQYTKVRKYYFLKKYSTSTRITFFRNFFFKKNASLTISPTTYFEKSDYKLNNIQNIDSSMLYKPRDNFKEAYTPPETFNLENYSWKDFR